MWNVLFYNIYGYWQLLGWLYAGSLFVGYRYSDFLTTAYGSIEADRISTGTFWYITTIIFLAVVLWPAIPTIVWPIVWNFYLTSGWCPPWLVCHSFNWPTGSGALEALLAS
jgi:hypothetical protein